MRTAGLRQRLAVFSAMVAHGRATSREWDSSHDGAHRLRRRHTSPAFLQLATELQAKNVRMRYRRDSERGRNMIWLIFLTAFTGLFVSGFWMIVEKVG